MIKNFKGSLADIKIILEHIKKIKTIERLPIDQIKKIAGKKIERIRKKDWWIGRI